MSISGTISSLNINGNVTSNKITGKLNIPQVYGSITYFPTIIVNPYGPEATALFNRMAVQPSTALKQLIDKTIADLKTAGIWQITDKFNKWDLHTEQASLLDWKNPAYNGTNYGATFVPAFGLSTVQGSTYLDLNFIPSLNCENATLNDLAFSLDDITAEITNSQNFGAYNTANNSLLAFRTMDIGSVRPWFFINSTAQKVWNGMAGINLYYNERPNATQIVIYRAPTTSTFGTSNSVAMIDQSLIIGGNRAANGGVVKYNISTSTFWLGKVFTPEQRTAWYNIIEYWKANVGNTVNYLFGNEMVVNGTFDTDTIWSKGTGITIENGKAYFNNVVGGNGIIQNVGLMAGKTYRIEYEISELVSGSVLVYLYGSNQYGATRRANGQFIEHITAGTGVTNFSIISNAATLKIDNVSVKEVLV